MLGLMPPLMVISLHPKNWHAYVYTAYVNKFGLQMLYTGLCNVSFGDQAFLTIPLQTFIMH